jgi:hypothetical protein
MRLAPFLVVFGSLQVGCGPYSASSGSGLDLTLAATAALGDLRGFQVALVRQGSSRDCTSVQTTYLKGQVLDTALYVPFKDSSGHRVKAMELPMGLVAGAPRTQDFSLTSVPVGKDYAVVIEALSTHTPPKLAGSSCNYVREVTTGTNAAVFARIVELSPPADCDALIEP